MALEKWSTMVLMAVFPERGPILSQIPWKYEIWLAIGKYETCKTLFQKLFQVEGLGNLATEMDFFGGAAFHCPAPSPPTFLKRFKQST